MNIRLNARSEQLLKGELSRGEFHSEEEVIERALETLLERTQRSATMDALAEGSDKLPVLSPEATWTDWNLPRSQLMAAPLYLTDTFRPPIGLRQCSIRIHAPASPSMLAG
jgi:Arc/MetJ-type ribon-helix-helix transcriptional regulator